MCLLCIIAIGCDDCNGHMVEKLFLNYLSVGVLYSCLIDNFSIVFGELIIVVDADQTHTLVCVFCVRKHPKNGISIDNKRKLVETGRLNKLNNLGA